MVSYAVYKVIHYLGIFSLVTAVAAALARGAARTGESARGAPDLDRPDHPKGPGDPWRRRLAVAHGTALVLILLGGFGMLARLGVDHAEIFPGWVWAKLAIWAVVGGLIAVARRSPRWSARALVAVPLLAAAAGFLAFTKVL